MIKFLEAEYDAFKDLVAGVISAARLSPDYLMLLDRK